MARIPEHTINQIIDAADIVEVIGSRIELKKKGQNFWASCPFHGEKTPSFSVSPTKQIYKCFGGCGAKGGVVNFLIEYEKLTFIEAIEQLAQTYGIKIEKTKDEFQTNNLKKELLEIHKIASEYYQESLILDENKKYLDYLNKRNISKEMIQIFEIGCCDRKTSELQQIIKKKEFSDETIKKSGVIGESQYGDFEWFYDRIIFPLKNPQSDVIGFAGRVLEDHPKKRKFINSFDNPIYNKSKNLYGLNLTKDTINKRKSVFVVEGQWDVVRLYQNDIKNVVGIGGTSLTDLQASIIKRYTTNIFILLDGDQAGLNAAIKSGYILLKHSINAKIIIPPNNYDPDDWLNTKNGKAELLDAKKNAQFTIQTHYNTYDKSTNNATNDFIEEAIDNIVEIKDDIFRSITIKDLSQIIGIDEKTILNAVNKKIDIKTGKRKTLPNPRPNPTPNSNINTNILIEDELIRLCLINKSDIKQFIFENMNKDWFSSELHKNIYNEIYIHLNSQYDMPTDLIINKTEDNIIRAKIIDLNDDLDKIKSSMDMAIDCLIRIERDILKKKIGNLRSQMKSANEELISSIIKEISRIQNDINELNNKYNESKNG
jgi:DNA primase